MNLIQIQDRLRSMPMPLLMQYANGSNPEVPPYVALAVLKEKETEQQQMSNMQGAAQGELPSVKSQLEQKMGVMQQQASMQPMGLQQPAAPAPQGPVQMASGGLASSAHFAHGGAVAFEDGGGVAGDLPEGFEAGDRYTQAMAKIKAEEKAKRGEPLSNVEKALLFMSKPLAAAADVAMSPIQGLRNIVRNPLDRSERPSMTPVDDARKRALYGDQVDPQDVKTVSEVPAGGPAPAAYVPRRPPQAMPAPAQGLGGARPPSAPQGPTGARPAAAFAPDSMEAMMRASLAKQPAAPTVEGAAGIVQGMQRQFGVDKPAGEEERALIAQMNQRYADSKKGKDLRDFQSVLSAFGRGPGAAGLEDVRLNAADLSADMAHQKGVYDMLNKINTANRTEQVGAAAKGMGIYGEQEKDVNSKNVANLQALTNARNSDVSANSALLAARINALNRTDPAEALRLKYLDQQQDSLVSELNKLPQFGIGVKEKRAELESKLLQIRTQLQKATGIDIMGKAPGATGAGGPPPPGAVREVKR